MRTLLLYLALASSAFAAPGPIPAPKATVTLTCGGQARTLNATSPSVCLTRSTGLLRGRVGSCTAASYVQWPDSCGDPSVHWSAQDTPPPPQSRALSILFVGNSLTSTPPEWNDYEGSGPMPNRLAPLLAELGVELHWQAVIQGGAEFSDHAANPATMALIADPRFDAVNDQGYYHFYDTAAHFQSAVQPLYNAARGAGSWSLFEAMWPYLGDGGSPQCPASYTSTEGAAAAMGSANSVSVSRAWCAIRDTNVALYAKLRADNTHQSGVGEYLTTLVYAKFISCKSVAATTFADPRVLARISDVERTQLKTAADAAVSACYSGPWGGSGGGGNTNQPPHASFTFTTSGLSATFTDTSTDPDGSIATRNWGFGDGTTGTGATITHTFPAANTYPVILNVTDNGSPPQGATFEANVTVTASTPPTLQPPVNQTQLIPFAKPARGVPFPTQFGTTETRITDHAVDRPGSTCARNDYSRRQPFNADKSRIFVYECGGNWLSYRTNPIAFEKVLSGPLADAEIQWSPTDPDKLYYIDTNGGSRIYELTVSTNTHTTFYDFGAQVQALLGPLADRCWTKSEGSPSADNRRWGFMCQHYTQSTGNFDMKGFAVLDVIARQVLWSKVTTTAPDHVSMTPSGRYFVPSGDDAQGTYAVRLSDGATCLLHHKSEHSDIGARSNGHDFYVSIDFQAGSGDVFWEDIDDCYAQPGPTRIATRNVVMHVYNNPWFGPHYSEHFSAKAVDFFTFAGYGYAPAPLLGYSIRDAAWYGLGATMTTCGDYFCEIQAAISRDGKSLLFNDTFGPTANVDAYRIDLP